MSELERAVLTISCRDTDVIPKVPDAGRVIETEDGAVQIMHNGVKVVDGCYYGDWMSAVIRGLRGHHEPQEELLYHEILKYCRHNTTMVELGCFWSYYSLWYLHEIPGSRTVGFEPDPLNREAGLTNMRLNGFEDRSQIHEGAIGGTASPDLWIWAEGLRKHIQVPCRDMDETLKIVGSPIEILHMDAQGGENAFIPTMAKAVKDGNVRFLFVSTHHEGITGSPTSHQDCISAIRQLGGYILGDHAVEDSYSADGLIVASFFAADRSIKLPEVSKLRSNEEDPKAQSYKDRIAYLEQRVSDLEGSTSWKITAPLRAIKNAASG